LLFALQVEVAVAELLVEPEVAVVEVLGEECGGKVDGISVLEMDKLVGKVEVELDEVGVGVVTEEVDRQLQALEMLGAGHEDAQGGSPVVHLGFIGSYVLVTPDALMEATKLLARIAVSILRPGA